MLDLTGSRIREQRLARGMKQAALAQAVGVSASYLNLIEHNHRRIGGKLLLAIARRLDVEPSVLTEGAVGEVATLLDAAARAQSETGAETERIDELSARFPGWTALIASQEARARDLENQILALRDRLTHDPVLAEAMHEVLSSVAAIRSTADILVRETDLDPAWRGRFHRNLNEEAERLSELAIDLLGQFEAQGEGEGHGSPAETIEAMFEASDHHFPEIEARGTAAIAELLERATGLDQPGAMAMAEARLRAYAQDAARLPLGPFLDAAQAVNFDPEPLVGHAGGDVGLVLRRLASIPVSAGAPPFGVMICDMSGALIHRRRLSGFPMPRVAAGCPLLPLYQALARPGIAASAILELPHRARFRSWVVAQPTSSGGFGDQRRLQSVMLVRADAAGPGPGEDSPPADAAPGLEVIAAGPGCDTCPRGDCRARRLG